MSKKLAHVHVKILKEDLDTLDTICTNHGDRSYILRTIINNFCKELRSGKVFDTTPRDSVPVQEKEDPDGSQE